MSKRQPIPNVPKHALEDAYALAIIIQRELMPLMVAERQALPTRTTIVVRTSRAYVLASKICQLIIEAHPTASQSKRPVSF